MRKKLYDGKLAEALSKGSTWSRIALLSLVSNSILGIAMIMAMSSQKTIIAPPGLSSNDPMKAEFWVKGAEASKSYLEIMTFYFAHLRLNYNKSNAQYQFDRILINATPSAYTFLKAKFDSDIERIKRNEISSEFHMQSFHLAGLKATIKGTITGYIGSAKLPPKSVEYEITYQIDSGMLSISGFKDKNPQPEDTEGQRG
ncbi:MAG: type IV conjugative transfer system protein TraE [Pseudobdellovibrionaceae bacterium]|nr:type IV conjugative transfer system protein TraE [Pseudobdellovibrionaceae bacterium]